MKYFPVIFLFLLSCQKREGEAVHNSGGGRAPQIIISSGQSKPYKTIRMNNINFDLVLNEVGDTIYLGTKDMKFVTSEGYAVGTKFEQLGNELKAQVTKENGWGYYVALNSGWKLGFCEGFSCTDKHLMDSSEVKWIFKRK